jgi:hypothetical protein
VRGIAQQEQEVKEDRIQLNMSEIIVKGADNGKRKKCTIYTNGFKSWFLAASAWQQPY